MPYSMNCRVRYSETASDGCLSIPGLVNYFQDCCTFHSEEAGVGYLREREKRRLWMLSAWQIVIERLPAMGEQIQVQTWAYEFSGFWGMRNFRLLDGQGCAAAWANSVWVFADADTGKPVRIDEEEIAAYAVEEKLDMAYAPRKISIPGEGEPGQSFLVCPHHLDTNLHVNNGQYIQMARDYFPEDAAIHQIRVEYRSQARLNDRICPFICRDGDRTVIDLQKENGGSWAVVELKS